MQKHILGLVLLLNLNLFSMDPKELDRRLEEANLRVAILGIQISELHMWQLGVEGTLLSEVQVIFNSGCQDCAGQGWKCHHQYGSPSRKECSCRELVNRRSIKLSMKLLGATVASKVLKEAIAKKSSNE